MASEKKMIMMAIGRYVVFGAFVLVALAAENQESICDVRLVDGPTAYEGRIEYTRFDASWNVTCGEFLGIDDVIVICKELNFSGANRAITDSPYGETDQEPSSYLECDGNEYNVSLCALQIGVDCSLIGAASCYDDSFIGCYPDTAVRHVLMGGSQRDPQTTRQNCFEFCREDSVENVYAGLGEGDMCFCGDANAHAYDCTQRVSDAFCQSLCAGRNVESCGGTNHIALFLIPVETPVTPSTPEPSTSDPMTTGATAEFCYEQCPQVCGQQADPGPTIGLGAVVALLVIYGIVLTVLYVRSRSTRTDTERCMQQYPGKHGPPDPNMVYTELGPLPALPTAPVYQDPDDLTSKPVVNPEVELTSDATGEYLEVNPRYANEPQRVVEANEEVYENQHLVEQQKSRHGGK